MGTKITLYFVPPLFQHKSTKNFHKTYILARTKTKFWNETEERFSVKKVKHPWNDVEKD